MYHNKERTRQLGWVRKKGVFGTFVFLVLIKSMDCCGDVDCCEESEVSGDKMDHTSRGTYLVQCIILKPGWD